MRSMYTSKKHRNVTGWRTLTPRSTTLRSTNLKACSQSGSGLPPRPALIYDSSRSQHLCHAWTRYKRQLPVFWSALISNLHSLLDNDGDNKAAADRSVAGAGKGTTLSRNRSRNNTRRHRAPGRHTGDRRARREVVT
jgi:hypothetical protein